MAGTLQDDLRRRTRNFTAPLPEDEVFRLGLDLARALAEAHAETPPRHPDLDPSALMLENGAVRLGVAGASTDVGEDLFQLGALLAWLLTGESPSVSWRLDGPPSAPVATVRRRAALFALASPRRADRFASASEAVVALEHAAPAVAGLTPEAEASGWPVFRGSDARTGAAPGPPPARLHVAWTLAAGPIVASPVISGDVVLAVTGDGRVLFVDRHRGRLLHELPVRSAVESSPALTQGKLLVGTDDGALVTIDVSAGTELARVNVGQMVRGAPLPHGERVLVPVLDGKGGGALAAIGSAPKPVWSFRLGPAFSSPALGGHVALVGSDSGRLHALDPVSGKEAWSIDLGNKIRATPAISAGVAVVGTFGGRLAAVSLQDGTLRWSVELGHPMYSSAALSEHLIVVGCNDGHLHGLDPASGRERFATPTGGPVIASPVAWGNVSLAASTDGSLYLFSAEGAVMQVLLASRAGIQSSPAVDRDLLVVGSGEGLHAVRLER